MLKQPFQTSFFLQPAHQEAPYAALSITSWHVFAEDAETLPPCYGHRLQESHMDIGAECSPHLFPFLTHNTLFGTTNFGRGSTMVAGLITLRIVSLLENSAPAAGLQSDCLQ